MEITTKRAYEPSKPGDGYRVLVDRLWPRGIKKADLKVDEWLKDIGPSDDLRKWFGHDPAKFQDFKTKYLSEIKRSGLADGLLDRAKGADKLTLVYSAKDEIHNQAVVLKSYLDSIN